MSSLECGSKWPWIRKTSTAIARISCSVGVLFSSLTSSKQFNTHWSYLAGGCKNTSTFLELFTKTSRGITNSENTWENQVQMYCWAAFHFPQTHYCERFFQETTLDTNQLRHQKGSYMNLRTLCKAILRCSLSSSMGQTGCWKPRGVNWGPCITDG